MRTDGTRRRRDGNRRPPYPQGRPMVCSLPDVERNFLGWFSIARLSPARPATQPTVSTPILEVRDLVKMYPAATAVAGISFSVPAGICFGLLGPNAAGKTTPIEMMEGILPPTSGEVRYRGETLGRRFREEAGILFQKTALQDFLTVRQCIGLFRGLYDRGLAVDELIRLCALEKLAGRDNRKLSGGHQQRLLLAIELANDPR